MIVTNFRPVRVNSVILILNLGTTFRSRVAGSVTRIEYDRIAKHGLAESLFTVSTVYIKTKDGRQEILLAPLEQEDKDIMVVECPVLFIVREKIRHHSLTAAERE